MTQYDIDLRDYWRIIKKRKMVIIFSMVMMFFFSFIFARYQKSRTINTFSSSCTIRIDKTIGPSDYYAQRFSQTDDIATEVKTITSFSVMAEVARRLGDVPDTLSNAQINLDPKLLSVVNDIASMVQPERSEYTNIITISVYAYDPVRARDIAQTTAEAYKDNRRNDLNRQTDNSIEFVKGQIKETEDSLRSAQKDFQNYSAENKELIPYFNSGGIQSDLVSLTRNRSAIEDKENSVNRMIDILKRGEQIENALMVSAFAEGEGAVFRQKYSELLKYYDDRNDLIQYLTPENPQVKAVNAKISSTNATLVSQLEGTRSSIALKKKDIDSQIDELRKQFSKAGENKYLVQGIDARIGEFQAQYAEYMKQLQALQIKKSEKIDEVTITRPAVFDRNPVNKSTSTAAITFIGILIGMVIGVVFGFVFETFDTSIGTIEDVETYLGVSVIGLIPQIDMSELRSDPSYLKGKNLRHEKADIDISKDHSRLIIHYAPKSVLAEAYRSLRTSIQFISYEREAKVLLFSSSSPQEGKTTTIVNLALTMAQSGSRVLLIDADLRKPKIDRIFGLDRDRGLAEIILGNHPWRTCVKTVTDIITGELGMTDIILTPGIDNLHLIVCGAIPPNPSELLNSANMDQFIAEVREAYDVVLFDCSPVLPATDTAVLGRKTDGVVFVYAFGKVARGSLKRAKAQLDTVSVRVIGVVLNGIRSDSSIDFQDYKYHRYYYAADAEEVEKQTPVDKIRRYLGDFMHRNG